MSIIHKSLPTNRTNSLNHGFNQAFYIKKRNPSTKYLQSRIEHKNVQHYHIKQSFHTAAISLQYIGNITCYLGEANEGTTKNVFKIYYNKHQNNISGDRKWCSQTIHSTSSSFPHSMPLHRIPIKLYKVRWCMAWRL